MNNFQYDNAHNDNVSRDYLTNKEYALLHIMSIMGVQNKELAVMFQCSLQTVKNQLKTVYDILGVKNRLSAVLWYNNNKPSNIETNKHYKRAMYILSLANGNLERLPVIDPRINNQTASDYKQWLGQCELMERETK